MLRYFFSVLFICILQLPLYGQEQDSIRKFIPTGIRIGVDVIPVIKTFTDNSYTGYEFAVDTDFYRYFLVAEYGASSLTKEVVNGNYENGGNYFRAGVDINFLKGDTDRNVFFLGFRYGRSSFNETLMFTTTDLIYGDQSFEGANGKLTGSWAEITSGLKVKIWKGLYLGFTGRFKFVPSVHGEEEFTPYDIPGYGLASENTYWGFNYQIFYRIPFRK